MISQKIIAIAVEIKVGNCLMRYLFCALLLSLISSKNIYACNDASVSQARSTLDKFLTNEYNGAVDTRLTLGAYRKNGTLISGERLNELSVPGVVIDLLTDPIVIVDGIQIQCRNFDAYKALFSVTFTSLAKSTGSGLPGRALLVEQEVIERTYVLDLIDDHWLVLDPSISFVSLETIKAAYEERIEIMNGIKKLSPQQKAIYDDLVAQNKVIKNIPANPAD